MPNIALASVHTTYNSATETDRQIRQVNERMSKVYPDDTPLVALLAKLAKTTNVKQNKIEWNRMSIRPYYVTVATAATVSATSIVLSDASSITGDVMLYNPAPDSLERILVLSKLGSTLTVGTRGNFGGTAKALTVGKILVAYTVSREEGADPMDPTGITPTMDYNYLQQMETVHAITDRAKGVAVYGDTKMSINDRESLNYYNRQREGAYLFGARKVIAAGSSGATTYGRWMCGGVTEFLETEGMTADANGAFTYPEFTRFMQEPTKHSGRKKFVAFGSMQVLSIMNFWDAPSNSRDVTKTDQFGIEITKFHGIGGWNLDTYHHELFETEGLHNQLLILDMNEIREQISIANPTHWNKGITGGKKDGKHVFEDQITGISSLEFLNPATGLIIRDIDT